MSKDQLKQEIIDTINNSSDKDVVKTISLFGSYLHNAYNEKSDVDLLIDFSQPVGFFTLIGIQEELEKKLRRPVDLVTRKSLSRHFRDKVIQEAETIYG